MAKYRKKPVVVEAMQTDGTTETADLIREWSNGRLRDHWIGDGSHEVAFYVDTLEGRTIASPRDWIILGLKGEYYPCRPDIFEATYDPYKEGD